jgi:hypothetical protein
VPGLVERDDALLAQQAVHQRGLADVGRPMMATRGWSGSSSSSARLERLERVVDELAHALAVLGRYRMGLTQGQLVELRRHDFFPHALGLVHRDEDGRVRLAQLLRDALVLRREARAPVRSRR